MTDLAEVAAAYVLGLVVCLGLWRGCRQIFDVDVFRRTNYRGHTLATGVGLLLPLTVVAVAGTHTGIVEVWSWSTDPVTGWAALTASGATIIAIAVGFAFLGLLDDLGGVGESGGFRGHLRALTEGRVTTGLLKMLGGPFVALVFLRPGTTGIVALRDAALVCLAANLANLFDRAPGRVNKVSQLAFVVLAVATMSAALVPVAVTLGAAAALLAGDLREEFMLGDAGSNVLGAIVGVGVVASTSGTTRWIVLAVLLALNLVSEFVSFTKVIDATPPLRWADRLGSPHRPR